MHMLLSQAEMQMQIGRKIIQASGNGVTVDDSLAFIIRNQLNYL